MSLGEPARPHSVPRRDANAAVAIVTLVRNGVEVASWPLEWWGRPALSVLDELTRLQLDARRAGCEMRLRDPRADLCELLDVLGLRDVLPGGGALRKMRRQPERSEERRVEEVVVPDDPIA